MVKLSEIPSQNFEREETLLDKSKKIELNSPVIENENFSNTPLVGFLGGISVRTYRKVRNEMPVSTTQINKSFTIFPNPITASSKLNIKWSNAITADQTIQVYNQAGILQQQEIIKINKSSNQQAIDLKQLLPGIYVIKITDNKTHKSSSQQFTVQ